MISKVNVDLIFLVIFVSLFHLYQSLIYESVLADAVVDKVIAELESRGFQCFIATIGGKGLQISSACDS